METVALVEDIRFIDIEKGTNKFYGNKLHYLNML